MSINASFTPLIQDLKAEYPDVNENVIINIVHSLNGHMPSIRAALDSRRSHRLVGSHHLNPPKMPQPHLPRGRPNSFPQFNQPLTIDVNEDRLPNHFQMETYTEIGRRPPPPSYVNAESNQNEISYIHQQRQRWSYLMNEISISKGHLNNIAADIRCREQLMNQREFGSDQTFPSTSHINMLKQEIVRKRLELQSSIPNSHPFTDPNYGYRQHTPRPINSVSAPGTPDPPMYNMRPDQRQLSLQPSGYSPSTIQYPPFSCPSPLPPPVPPHRSGSTRSQPGAFSGRSSMTPPNVPGKHGSSRHSLEAGYTSGGSGCGHHSRSSSQRNSVDVSSVIESEEHEGAMWNCSKCTFLNHPAMRVCEMCDTPKVIPLGI